MNCQGTTLIMGMVFLFGLSLLALSGTSGMLLQQQMASNFRDALASLKLAENALLQASSWLMSLPGADRTPDCITECLLPAAIHPTNSFSRTAEFEGESWWSRHGVIAGIHPETREPFTEQSTPASSAYWLIEEISFEALLAHGGDYDIHGIGYYRILARGLHRLPGSRAVIETIVARPWGSGITPEEFPSIDGPLTFCRQFDHSEFLSSKCGRLSWRQLQ